MMTRAEAEQQKRHILILTLGIALALALGVLLLYPFEEGRRIYPLSLLVLVGLFSFYIIEKNGQVIEALRQMERGAFPGAPGQPAEDRPGTDGRQPRHDHAH